MALDYEKVKDASLFHVLALFVCEFSRGVDALERIAPDAGEPAVTEGEAPVPVCPHPKELRVNLASMGQEPFAIFKCGVCGDTVNTLQPVEA